VDDLPAEGLVADVSGETQHFPTSGGNLLLGLAGIRSLFLGAQIEHGHPGALPGKMHRHRPADAAVRATDDGNLAFKLAGTPILIGDEHRLRMHFLLRARLLLLMLWWGSLLVAHAVPHSD